MNNKSKDIGYYYEKFRAFLLVFLMLLCVVQVGILWSSQSGSFPVSFLSSIFSNTLGENRASIEESKGDYLLPYRVMISTGYKDDHYIIPNGSADYNTLWEGAKLYISEALELKPKNIQDFNEDKWATIVANNPYTFEFKTQIPIEIIKWVIGQNKISAGEGLSGIYKISICPDDPDSNYLDTLSIRDDKNIYTYEIPNFNEEALNKEEFNKIYLKQQSNFNSKNYEIAKEKYGSKINITQDMLGPFAKKSTEIYTSITCLPFAGLDGKTKSFPDEYNSIAKELFGQARSDYEPDLDVNGTPVFKKLDSVYRLYSNSVLEYRFIGSQGNTERTKVLDAYKKAIGFIMDHSSQSDFMSGISIYLKSITESQNSYIFNFDYSISLGEENGEVPLLIKNYKSQKNNSQLDYSISVQASSKRVIHCDWIALKFKVEKNFKSYKWDFADMHAEVFKAYTELKNTEFSAKDYGIYYLISYPETLDKSITPSFVLYTDDGRYDIPMKGNIN